jgi:hypothetical protein
MNEELLEILPTEVEVENAFEKIMDIKDADEDTNYFLSSNSGSNEIQPCLF